MKKTVKKIALTFFILSVLFWFVTQIMLVVALMGAR